MIDLLFFFGGIFIGLALGMCIKIVIVKEETDE